MNDLLPCRLDTGRDVWRVADGYHHAACWPVRPCASRNEVVVRLAVGPAGDEVYHAGGDARILLDGVTVDSFVLDTGAQHSLFSANLAKRLGLYPATRGARAHMPDGSEVWCGHATACVNVGSNWFVVPCVFPYFPDGDQQVQNLLGMKGLLADHLFCIAHDEVRVFYRRPPAGGRQPGAGRDSERHAEPLTFFLGGGDLEMAEIARLLAGRPGVAVCDRGLAWGARASAHLPEIRAALATGRRAVLVELADDLPPDVPRDRLTWIDHHGPLAGADRPTALEQVFALLALPAAEWTRDRALVAANDRGHVAGLLRAGATAAEVRSVRDRDRHSQGVTADEEASGREAAAAAETHLGGRLTVVRLPHARTAVVTDALDPALGGPGYENLLVLCPAEAVFFGSGAGIAALRAAHPDGWYGGELPARGFWGVSRPVPLPDLLRTLESAL